MTSQSEEPVVERLPDGTGLSSPTAPKVAALRVTIPRVWRIKHDTQV
jgi:hypothetical protein